jgi:hypothetical protein
MLQDNAHELFAIIASVRAGYEFICGNYSYPINSIASTSTEHLITCIKPKQYSEFQKSKSRKFVKFQGDIYQNC